MFRLPFAFCLVVCFAYSRDTVSTPMISTWKNTVFVDSRQWVLEDKSTRILWKRYYSFSVLSIDSFPRHAKLTKRFCRDFVID